MFEKTPVSLTALPSDVRKGSALPECDRFGFEAAPHGDIAPIGKQVPTEGQSPSAHRTAEPLSSARFRS